MKKTNTTKPTATSVDEIRAAAANVGVLQQQMTFLVQLTDAERREHQSARIGLRTLRKIENRLVAAREHRDLLPEAFDLRKFERDTVTAGALAECLSAVDKMRDAVYDTLLAVTKRASVAANSAYGHIKVGSTTATSLKRTVEKLGNRAGRTPTAEPTGTPIALPATAPPEKDASAAKDPSAPTPTNKAA